jgi:putative transposase
MSHFQRAYVPAGSFFFTVVTERRAPILCTDTSRVFLRTVIRECRQHWPFRLDAMVFPEGDTRYLARWEMDQKGIHQGVSGRQWQRRLPPV